jgi:Na+-driven multidrug efflux pump
MQKCRRYALKCSVIITTSIGLLFFAAAGFIMRAFIPDSDVISQGTVYLRIHVLCLPFLAMNYALRSMFQAVGKGFRALTVSVCRQGLMYIPFLFLLNALVGVRGVVAAQIVADALSLVVAYALLPRKRPGFPGF